MTNDVWKSLIIKVLVMVFTALSTHLHLNFSEHETLAMSSDLATILILGYGFWRSYGSKLVPHNSVAIASEHIKTLSDGTAIVNAPAKTPSGELIVRVVGCLLALALVLPLYMGRAQAQTATSPASSQLTAAQAQIYSALNTVIGFVGGFIQADLNAAIADAQAQSPPNTQAIACWQAIAKIPVTSVPNGAGLAYLKQRFLDLQGLYMPLNLNCGSVAPLFLKQYNQFMSLAASQNL